MGNIPRSTRALEISVTNRDSCPASVACSTSALSMHTQSPSSSANRSHPLEGCRLCACSSANIASCTFRSVSYKQRRICHSSNIRLRLMECLDLELEARILAWMSYWAASAWTRSVLCSMRTLSRTHTKVASPSSHTVTAPCLLSSSLPQARSCSCSSVATIDVTATPGGEEGLDQSTSGNQCHDKKQAQASTYAE
jgi:hypothetical protein